jgi:hypothetical protein
MVGLNLDLRPATVSGGSIRDRIEADIKATSPPSTRERNGRMIMATETGHVYQVTGDKPRLIDEDLGKAVELLQRRAIVEGRHGILVTRHSAGSFSVTMSADVPYGVTRESCEMGTPHP